MNLLKDKEGKSDQVLINSESQAGSSTKKTTGWMRWASVSGKRLGTPTLQTLTFIFVYPALGLLQLWIAKFQGHLKSTPSDFKTLAANGVLLFFATALFSGALDSLLTKRWLAKSQLLLVSTLFIGFGTFFIVVSIYPEIPTVPIANATTQHPLAVDMLDRIWQWSLILVVGNLIFAFLVRQLPAHRPSAANRSNA